MTSQPQELEADPAKVADGSGHSDERSRDVNEGANDSSGASTPQAPPEPTEGSTSDGPETDAGDDLDTDFLDMLYFAPPPPETEQSTAEETPPAPIDEEQWLKELEGDVDVPSIPVEEIWSDIVGGMSKIRIKQQEQDEVADDNDYADFVDCLDKEAEDATDGPTKTEKEAIYASFVEFFHSPEGQAMFATNGNSEGVTADAMWEQIVSGMDQPGWYTPLWVRLGDCFAAEKGGKLDQHGHAIEEEVSPWLSCFKTLFAVNVVAAATEHTEEESKECDLEEGLNPLSPV